MSRNKCCVPMCSVTNKDDVHLHIFPDPKKDPERFRMWVLRIGGEIIGLDNNTIFKTRKVCHRHFQDNDIYLSNRLSKTAVPQLHMPAPHRMNMVINQDVLIREESSAAAIPQTLTQRKYSKRGFSSRCPLNSDEDDTIMRVIPNGMKLGVATSSFQIEGAWNASDKSPSMWDTYCHTPGKISDGTTADDACKSYEFYQRDIQMLKYLGVDFYRFSISWPRVLPNGFANVVSQDGIDYYNKLIDGLLAEGITPMVTIYHWDLPQNLQDLGGWTNPYIAIWFEDYARVLYEAFGDRVKHWITVNEPKQFAMFGYGTGRFAPGFLMSGIADYMAVKNLLIAHANAWHLYDKEYRQIQNGVCGITIATDFREGASDSPSDLEAGNLAMDFEVGLYSDPIFSKTGGYPKEVEKRIAERSAAQGFPRSRLPALTSAEIEYIKGTSDFYGFNHYSSLFFTEEGYTPGKFPVPSYNDDIGAVGSFLDYEKAPIIHTTSIPCGIRKALNWVRTRYNNPPIMITENGYGTFGGIDDQERVTYYKQNIEAVLDAVEDGCNVTTYTAWSLMDNFEWSMGYTAKFGLFEVDFEDDERTRKAKTSAIWFRHLVATRKLDPNYEPKLIEITF